AKGPTRIVDQPVHRPRAGDNLFGYTGDCTSICYIKRVLGDVDATMSCLLRCFTQVVGIDIHQRQMATLTSQCQSQCSTNPTARPRQYRYTSLDFHIWFSCWFY